MHRKLVTPWKPSKAQVLAARNKFVPDLAAKNLVILFVGINPGLYTAAIGHHFGRPGNRFWPALHGGGFTPRLFSPFEESLLLDLKLGITNIVKRATARADELTDDELRAGGGRLEAKVRRWRPTVVAFAGIHPYRVVSGIKDARVSPFSAAVTLGFFPIPVALTPTTSPPPWRNCSETCAFGPLQSTSAAKIAARVIRRPLHKNCKAPICLGKMSQSRPVNRYDPLRHLKASVLASLDLSPTHT